MAKTVRTEIQGLDQIARVLQALVRETGERVLVGAVGAMASVIVKQARANVGTLAGIQRRTGTLDRAFYRMRIRALTNDQQSVWIVGVHQGKRFQSANRYGIREEGTGRDAYYWWWLEFGKKGRTGTPFLGPALPMQRDNAIEVFRKRCRDGIEKIVRANGGGGMT